MSRDLQLDLHQALTTATNALDLPLDQRHLERLAVHLTPQVKAFTTTVIAATEDDTPIRYRLSGDIVPASRGTAVEITQQGGCTFRIGLDVDQDSPAAVLAHTLNTRQPDVIGADVPDSGYLALTVRPQSLPAWRWWLSELNVHPDTVNTNGPDTHAVGAKDGVVVELRGAAVGTLLALADHGRPALAVDMDSPAGTVATMVRRQRDVTASEILDAHTIAVTVRPACLRDWRWWLDELGIDPAAVAFQGADALATGHRDDAVVHLRGDDVPALYTDRAVARLMGLLVGTWP